MNEKAAKGVAFFLFLMALFTFVSWKLDVLRTPQVLCMEAGPGVIDGEIYDSVLPSEAVYSGETPYVYVVEESKSYFHPVVARRATVLVLASGGGRTAVQNLPWRAQVVRFTDRALSGGTVPVRLGEGQALAGRVEVVPAQDLDSAEALVRQAAVWEEQPWEISREGDRLVLENVDQFTAQMVRAALAAGGVEGQVLDYAWGPDVLEQSGRLWKFWAAAMVVWLAWSLLRTVGCREWDRAQEALEEQYLGAYLADAGVRLMVEALALAAGVVLAAAAAQWLWRTELVLPRNLLPEGSVFDVDYYRMWMRSTFPGGGCSGYGADLAAGLRQGHLLAAAECAGLTVCAAALRGAMKRDTSPIVKS